MIYVPLHFTRPLEVGVDGGEDGRGVRGEEWGYPSTCGPCLDNNHLTSALIRYIRIDQSHVDEHRLETNMEV